MEDDNYSKIVLAVVGIVFVFAILLVFLNPTATRVGKGTAAAQLGSSRGGTMPPLCTGGGSMVDNNFKQCGQFFDVFWRCWHKENCKGNCDQFCCGTKSFFELIQECENIICPNQCKVKGVVVSQQGVRGGIKQKNQIPI